MNNELLSTAKQPDTHTINLFSNLTILIMEIVTTKISYFSIKNVIYESEINTRIPFETGRNSRLRGRQEETPVSRGWLK